MGSEMNKNIPGEQGSTSAENIMGEGSQTYEQTRRRMSQFYDRSAHAIGQTYDQAIDYGRSHPGKAVFIAFGVGIGVGMMLLGTSRRSRVSRYGVPIVNALSHMAMEFIRTL